MKIRTSSVLVSTVLSLSLLSVACGKANLNATDASSQSSGTEDSLGLAGSSERSKVARQVNAFYQECLSRAGDAKGLNFYTGLVLAGKLTLAQARNEICTSHESIVVKAYKEILDRVPDSSGRTFYTQKLASGELTAESLRRELGKSAESKEKSRSTVQAFVQGVYQTCLGRVADAPGLDYHTDVLLSEKQTPQQVENSICNSPEAGVVKAYNEILGRKPDAGGLAYWTGEVIAGRLSIEQVRASLLASPERQAQDVQRKIVQLRQELAANRQKLAELKAQL